MSLRIWLTPEAEQELKSAVDWYDEKSPGAGQRLAHAVRNIAVRAAENPQRYRLVSRYTRRANLGDWKYAIYFTVDEIKHRLVVVAVFHGSRDPTQINRRLK